MVRVILQLEDYDVHFVLDQHAQFWIFIMLADWNNTPWVDMSVYLDILSWFQANQSLL